MISDELETRFEKLQATLTQAKREDALQDEIKQMRALVFDILKQKPAESGSQDHTKTDPMLTMLLSNQSELNKSLLMHTLAKTDKEDPVQKMLMQEILNLKNQRSAPRSITTSEELTQRINLQKLANEMELSQSEFKDKSEGRAFARDLAGQALTKIGESVANAYLEAQRIAAMQLQTPQSVGLTPPPAAPMAPPVPSKAEIVPDTQQVVKGAQTGTGVVSGTADPQAPADQDSNADKYRVRGTPMEDGTISIPCPTCGTPMFAHPGDTKVNCHTCGSSFNAGSAPPQHEYAGGDELPVQETTEEPVREASQDTPEEPVRKPKVLL